VNSFLSFFVGLSLFGSVVLFTRCCCRWPSLPKIGRSFCRPRLDIRVLLPPSDQQRQLVESSNHPFVVKSSICFQSIHLLLSGLLLLLLSSYPFFLLPGCCCCCQAIHFLVNLVLLLLPGCCCGRLLVLPGCQVVVRVVVAAVFKLLWPVVFVKNVCWGGASRLKKKQFSLLTV